MVLNNINNKSVSLNKCKQQYNSSQDKLAIIKFIINTRRWVICHYNKIIQQQMISKNFHNKLHHKCLYKFNNNNSNILFNNNKPHRLNNSNKCKIKFFHYNNKWLNHKIKQINLHNSSSNNNSNRNRIYSNILDNNHWLNNSNKQLCRKISKIYNNSKNHNNNKFSNKNLIKLANKICKLSQTNSNKSNNNNSN